MEDSKSQNRKGVAEVFSEKRVKRTQRREKLTKKEVGCGAAPASSWLTCR